MAKKATKKQLLARAMKKKTVRVKPLPGIKVDRTLELAMRDLDTRTIALGGQVSRHGELISVAGTAITNLEDRLADIMTTLSATTRALETTARTHIAKLEELQESRDHLAIRIESMREWHDIDHGRMNAMDQRIDRLETASIGERPSDQVETIPLPIVAEKDS